MGMYRVPTVQEAHRAAVGWLPSVKSFTFAVTTGARGRDAELVDGRGRLGELALFEDLVLGSWFLIDWPSVHPACIRRLRLEARDDRLRLVDEVMTDPRPAVVSFFRSVEMSAVRAA